MSTYNVSLNRKRRLDYETSDSDDDLVPVRKLQRCQKPPSLKESFTNHCKSLWQWISELPLKDYFKDSMYKKSLIYTNTIGEDVTDEDEREVIDIEDDDDDEEEEEVIDDEEEDDDDVAIVYASEVSSPAHGPKENGITQNPKNKPLEIDLVEAENGCKPISSSTPFVRRPHKKGYKNNSNGYLAPLTNPGVDVEILLDSDETDPSLYTAHEVVRLQEKAKYKLLLDKVVSESVYRPVVSRRKALEIDLTQEEDEVSPEQRYEYLYQPVRDFVTEFYRPHPPAPPPPTTDEDDDVLAVVPLPTYRPKPRRSTSIFFSPDWIQELRMTISSETEKRLQIIAEEEKKLKRYRNRRDAKIAAENRRRDELMSVMLPHLQVEKEDEFPPLTAEMNALIDDALEAPPSRVLCSVNRVEITHTDIATLTNLNWLNDTIINCYLSLIAERSRLEGFPSVYAFSSFFFTSLMTRGASNVLRWTRKVDVFAHDILFVPLHMLGGVHWALGVIDNRTKKISYYDSMYSKDQACLQQLQRYIVAEMKDKKKIDIDPDTYSLEVVKDIPQQMNGSDCGMFTLKYAEYISRDAPIAFSQMQMPYFRRKMIYELLTNQLL